MKPFGDHLSADKYICFVSAKLLKKLFVAVFLLRCIAVHAESADLGEKSMKGALDMFCSKALKLERFWLLTVWTRSGSGLGIVAKMALEKISVSMEGE